VHLNYYTPAINSPEVGEYVNPLMVGVTVTLVGSRVGLLLGRGDGSRVGFVLGDIVGAREGTSECMIIMISKMCTSIITRQL
jgi:hypothetical protein